MNHLAHLRLKAKALFALEDKLDNAEKAAHQWQLLTQVCGVNVIVGKGGVNTAFYVIGDLERVICYPDEMVLYLDTLSKQIHPIYCVMTDPKTIQSTHLSLKEAKQQKAGVGHYIVGITAHGKRVRLYRMSKSLLKLSWLPFTSS